MFGHCGGMFGIIANGKESAVDLGVQRLDPPIHHLGKAGEFGDVEHRQPGIAQRLGGAAGRNQLDAPRGQRLAEIGQPGLVRHRKQRPAD